MEIIKKEKKVAQSKTNHTERDKTIESNRIRNIKKMEKKTIRNNTDINQTNEGYRKGY